LFADSLFEDISKECITAEGLIQLPRNTNTLKSKAKRVVDISNQRKEYVSRSEEFLIFLYSNSGRDAAFFMLVGSGSSLETSVQYIRFFSESRKVL
jgi:hypothetical protein